MKIYIGGISKDVTADDLQQLYSQFGKLTKVDLLKDPETTENRGYAFVEFENDMEGDAAILGTNNTLLGENSIQVSVSRSRLDQKREKQKKFKKRPFEANNNNGEERSVRSRPSGPRNFERNSNNNVQHKSFGNNNNRSFDNNTGNNRNYDNNNGNSRNYDNNRNFDNNDRGNYNNRRSSAGNTNYSSNNFVKGVDYGRSGIKSPNRPKIGPQTSFLGQEDFGASPRVPNNDYNSNNLNSNPRPPRPRYNKDNNRRSGNYNNSYNSNPDYNNFNNKD